MLEEKLPAEEDVSFEQIVLSIGEVFVYKVPPLRTASGHR